MASNSPTKQLFPKPLSARIYAFSLFLFEINSLIYARESVDLRKKKKQQLKKNSSLKEKTTKKKQCSSDVIRP